MNVEPAPGEEAIYFGPGRPFTFDYAVIARLPNLHPERKVLILAGTNTLDVAKRWRTRYTLRLAGGAVGRWVSARVGGFRTSRPC